MLRLLTAVMVTAALAAPASAAPDCAGGSVRVLRVRTPSGVYFRGTVTRAGATHATLVSASPGLTVRVFAADDGAVLYEETIPPERFVTEGRVTRYDGGGDFVGRIFLKDSRFQADTVDVFVSATDASAIGSLPATTHLRVEINTAAGCARTCAADCPAGTGSAAGGAIATCRPSPTASEPPAATCRIRTRSAAWPSTPAGAAIRSSRSAASCRTRHRTSWPPTRPRRRVCASTTQPTGCRRTA
jgi:hypothetical protein